MRYYWCIYIYICVCVPIKNYHQVVALYRPSPTLNKWMPKWLVKSKSLRVQSAHANLLLKAKSFQISNHAKRLRQAPAKHPRLLVPKCQFLQTTNPWILADGNYCKQRTEKMQWKAAKNDSSSDVSNMRRDHSGQNEWWTMEHNPVYSMNTMWQYSKEYEKARRLNRPRLCQV